MFIIPAAALALGFWPFIVLALLLNDDGELEAIFDPRLYIGLFGLGVVLSPFVCLAFLYGITTFELVGFVGNVWWYRLLFVCLFLLVMFYKNISGISIPEVLEGFLTFTFAFLSLFLLMLSLFHIGMFINGPENPEEYVVSPLSFVWPVFNTLLWGYFLVTNSIKVLKDIEKTTNTEGTPEDREHLLKWEECCK